eukprot:GHVL01041948.1.p1 GENE.GHVL01041948.1~~GHVL01041948.1.p1  ORF type:complete len:161 (+),score=23.90 GHVL01041948.1:77-559(+)
MFVLEDARLQFEEEEFLSPQRQPIGSPFSRRGLLQLEEDMSPSRHRVSFSSPAPLNTEVGSSKNTSSDVTPMSPVRPFSSHLNSMSPVPISLSAILKSSTITPPTKFFANNPNLFSPTKYYPSSLEGLLMSCPDDIFKNICGYLVDDESVKKLKIKKVAA